MNDTPSDDDENQLWLFEGHADVPPHDVLPEDEALPPAHDHDEMMLEEHRSQQFDLTEYPYFVLADGEATGPFMPSEILEKQESGEIAPDAYVWNQTLDEWLPLNRVFGVEPVDDWIENVEPPEEPAEASYTIAGFGPRFIAGAADLGIIVGTFFAACVLIPPFRQWIETTSQNTAEWLQVNVLLSAPIYLYFMLSFGPWGRGRSPGYRLAHLQLVDQETRRPPTWLQSLLWCIGSIVLIFGFVFYWFDRRHRMLHNGMSRTIVLQLPQ